MEASLSIVLFVLALLVLLLPREHLMLPLLVCACYLPIGPALELESLSFSSLRLLIGVAHVRFLLRGEYRSVSLQPLDYWITLWAVWSVLSSLLHEDIPATLINRMGMVYNVLGIYCYLRVVLQSVSAVWRAVSLLALLWLPLALEMSLEQLTGRNLFHWLGGLPELAESRGDRIRAQGPFAHPILAGTVGAVMLPLMLQYRRASRGVAWAGTAASLTLIAASASSGPILAALAGLAGLWLWQKPARIKGLLLWGVSGYVIAELLMQAPAYYLVSRIDLTGGSTGWHRAALIEAALQHLEEWWLAGSDYTRHWLPYGVSWSENHVDITNYFIRMGVDGGLLQMLLFLKVLQTGFGRVCLLPVTPLGVALGASLCAHVVSFLSVAYFDQSIVFLYLILAAMAALEYQASPETHAAEPQPVFFRYATVSTGVLKG